MILFYSIFNLAEVDMVVMYIKLLLTTKFCKHEVLEHDIGVVTPYKMQASKILEEYKLAFNVENTNITIGTAAILQGQEKQIIIISTVSVGYITDFAADFRV